jgi:tripeptidyl-peptidase I
MCGAYKPTNVISISYGYGESTRLEYSYENRQCQEFLKLGLQGVTVIVSSGDSGVASHEGCTFRGDGSSPPSGSFTGDFPNTCPYVTSVEGTMVSF